MTHCECGAVADRYASRLVGFTCCDTCATEVLEQAHRDGGHTSNEHAGECAECDEAIAKVSAEEDWGDDDDGIGHTRLTQQEAYDHENPPLRDDPMEYER